MERLFPGTVSDASLAAEIAAKEVLVKLVGKKVHVRSYSDMNPVGGQQIIVHEYETPNGLVREVAIKQLDGSWNFKIEFPDSLAPLLDDKS